MRKYFIISIMVILGLTNCLGNKSSILSYQQIYPLTKEEVTTCDKTIKDKIMKAIFPDSEIKPFSKNNIGEYGEYLVIGKKRVAGSVLPDAEPLPLEKYVSINSIMRHQVFPDKENQVIVTLDIYTPHSSAMGVSHVAVIILVPDKDNYKIHTEYYICGRTFAPTSVIDLNNDGLMEVVVFKGIWWGHPWGGKYLNLLQVKGTSLLNILETEIIGWDYAGGKPMPEDPEGGRFFEDYKAMVEVGNPGSTAYCSIIKTSLQVWYPDAYYRDRTKMPVQSIQLIREIFKWDGKKYILSSKQVLLELIPAMKGAK